MFIKLDIISVNKFLDKPDEKIVSNSIYIPADSIFYVRSKGESCMLKYIRPDKEVETIENVLFDDDLRRLVENFKG